jgi:hypothetical protein
MLTLGGLNDGGKIFIKIIFKMPAQSTEIQFVFITKTNSLRPFKEIFAVYVKPTNRHIFPKQNTHLLVLKQIML